MKSSIELIKLAQEASKNAYVPFSNFHVGAAIEAKDGTIFSGCNIENSSYGATNCAERTAIFKAVSEGYGENSFEKIAIVCESEEPGSPCGICRQVMYEFMDPNTTVILGSTLNDNFIEYKLGELLPYGFKL